MLRKMSSSETRWAQGWYLRKMAAVSSWPTRSPSLRSAERSSSRSMLPELSASYLGREGEGEGEIRVRVGVGMGDEGEGED